MNRQSGSLQRTPRLYVPASLASGAAVVLKDQQAHYLLHVMRLQRGATFRLFNGADGEWLAEIIATAKRDVTLRCDRKLRDPSPLPDIDYLFAPLKHAQPLESLLSRWERPRQLVWCDETGAPKSPLAVLERLQPGPMAVLVGPEGGFTSEEQGFLRGQDFVHAISLGPRVIRADTAAVAALALVQAVLGDWQAPIIRHPGGSRGPA